MTLPALEQAITFLSRADLIATARQQSLPVGVTEVLKISSGDSEALLKAQESSRYSQEDVRHAAQFYVQQILFAPDSDHYRVLGVDPDDVEAKIKLHYRLLVRWLHPDKNSSDWEAVFSDRVNRAWHSLRTPERRREYDQLLKSQYSHQPASNEPSRELKPSQLRRDKVDERFMSSRTIKRLPIAVFGMLGISAVFALWWLSQLQPNLQATDMANNVVANKESVQQDIPAITPTGIAPVDVAPAPQAAKVMPEAMPVATPESAATAPLAMPEVQEVPAKETTRPPVIAAINTASKATVVVPQTKPVMLSLENKTTPPPAATKKITTPEKKIPATEMALLKTPAKEEKIGQQKNKATKTKAAPKPEEISVSDNVRTVATEPVNTMASAGMADTKSARSYDTNVKQFLQQFSRIYAEGDYFALHNLFTRDLSILSAPPQRSVLRSYRHLFENSQSREIALDHVTWLANDENIVVIASYQTQVTPHGKSETESSKGDIRLDLRMENGQLRIIRLQSDTKNG